MVKSMTGYGRGTRVTGDLEITVEVRTLNHRYLEIGLRVPSTHSSVEPHIRDMVRRHIGRGKVDVIVNIKDKRERVIKLTVNGPLLKGYLEVDKELRDTFGLPGSLGVEKAMSLNGVLSVWEVEIENDPLHEMVLSSLKEALKGVSQMREAEGKSIEKFLRKEKRSLRSINRKIEGLSEKNKKIMGQKLKDRICDFLVQAGSSIDNLDERIAVEIAILADRLDVSEEVKRIGSHLEQFDTNLSVKTGSVGRKLDFIIQELNREFNTIGSKSQSAKIPSLVIEAKANLEKMREQVQNVE